MLKGVGGITAILSLVFGVRQLTVLVSDFRDGQRQVAELIAVAKLQREARDYRPAWASLEKAAELRASESTIRAAQEDLAMAWLNNIRGSQSSRPFTATVDTLTPVLTRGVVVAEGPRKADLIAHLGWADFLRWRDGERSLEPVERYRQALAVDSQNVYAHAMLAHWTLWNGGNLEDANRHFATALRSGRERPLVRRLQLAALSNIWDTTGELETLRAPSEDSIGQLFAAVPLAEQVATYRWSFEKTDYVESESVLYEYHLARLQDAAGQDADALATYRSVRSKLTPATIRRIRDRVDSAIVRLTRGR